MVIANGYSTSHFDHMYTWAPDWACSDIIEYESATECDLSDSTVYSSWPWKMKKTLENSLKRPGISWTKRVGTLILYTFTEYRSISDRMFTGYRVFVHLQNIDPSVTECSQVTVCLFIWYHLLSCDMSEEQSSCFVQSIYNVSWLIAYLLFWVEVEEVNYIIIVILLVE